MAQRTTLVTGASRGIGRAIALRFAAGGHHVGLLARSTADLEGVAEEIQEAGGTADILAADLLEIEATTARLKPWLEDNGGVDVLVNNAGTSVRKPAEAFSLAEWNDLQALLLTAPYFLSTTCAAGMRVRGRGRIVNVGSVAGMAALPNGAPYAAAKAGLAQLTRNLAREWGGDGVTVNLVAPWYVRTPLTDGVLSDPGFHAAVLACTPTGRTGTPEEVAEATWFLASDEAAWINGAVLPMDGGFTAASFFPPGV